MPKMVTLGKNQRLSFSKIEEIQEMPNLIEVQKKSYQWFVENGLREVFRDVSYITDYTGNLVLEFIDYTLEKESKYSVAECKERDATYAAPLKVRVRLVNRETMEVKEQEIFMGDFPLMTDSGTFIINGAERVIVSQLVRSPGIYYDVTRDKSGASLFSAQIIPNRGAWLEYETDSAGVYYVRIDKNRKIPATVLLRALGLATKEEILDMYGETERMLATLEKDPTNNVEEGLIEMYKKLRPGEPPTVESAQSLLNSMFFDARRYDLSKVGRFKYNQKLDLSTRVAGKVLARDAVAPYTGELLFPAGTLLTRQQAAEIAVSGIDTVYIKSEALEIKVFSNGMVSLPEFLAAAGLSQKYAGLDCEKLELHEKVSYKVLVPLLEQAEDGEALQTLMADKMTELVPKHIAVEDILASFNYLVCLSYDIGTVDDIDHLGNRRIRSVGELLQNQFRIGLARMERVIKERMTTQNMEIITPQALINIRPVVASIKEFFGSSPLSQFMDQTNPLAELTHKRRLSALGPGGLSRDRAGFEVRDVHHSHYGRMCPIETPEGPNIGLISYLSTYARINDYGFIEAPYRKVDKATGAVTGEVVYMTADIEDEFIVAQASEPLDEKGRFIRPRVAARFRDEILEIDRDRIDYMDISPKMVVSVATAMIPFLENDDANRALMGSNMQRQAVPLLRTESPVVGTGMEYKAAVDSGVCVLARRGGTVKSVDARNIAIDAGGGDVDKYELIKFLRSNQGTCINQKPIVAVGQKVEAGEVVADGPSTQNGEIALGRNVLIGFMTWEGFNYEDAVLLNERLVRDDVFTSIHIEEYELEERETKLGNEEITRDIPGLSEDSRKDLDASGVIRIGAEVHSGDILVGKITPKGETELTAEERLLRAIFGEKVREVRDTSLKVPHGESGIVVDVKVFDRENGDEMSPGVNKVVRCYIAQKRKISVGDKMAGRHGNKGVVSRVLPQEDMPFLPDGTPLDIVLNPLGVPSRMNIGQVLEVHLGLAAKALGVKVMTPVFDGAKEEDITGMLRQARDSAQGRSKLQYNENGKTVLYDGRTGMPFDNPVTVGYMHFLKLAHLVDDKIHARSNGPYSLVTQQPLGGKAQFGGQRFGEMEVWALEAYGAAYTLQEILTVKSDDTIGRVKTFESIVKGENVPKPGIPESFKVLIKELQSLALDVRVLDENREEIVLRDSFDDGDDFGMHGEATEDYYASDEELELAGYAIEEVEGELEDADYEEEDEESDTE
ncbi:MAG TPA: DNA-directed RNA polymerase subunit beta [Candidatus Acidoferrum sp.]|nr:DNA-directed RNA polymerase subunit beta [Candidatus Acidoferrum sp.]